MKTLGLDLGTSSIGWAIVDKTNTDEYVLLDKGVDIFQEGVAREKNNEKPAVQPRTEARALRRHYFRRRLRKIELLKVLIRYDMCPPLTDAQLDEWRSKKRYPIDDEFLLWQRTDDNTDKNPYHDRYTALTTVLDLSKRSDRHLLGRAMYHLAQRRGFLSNRKDATDEKENGKVETSITELTKAMSDCGYSYLGEYFYKSYRKGEKIRTKYTARKEHYEAEFDAICDKQKLSEELRKALHRAIFFQRDLKSQKGSVGKCTFEKKKPRCPISHPRFEEFRMLSFINNIRITAPCDSTPRPLSSEETAVIYPLFFRKSKSHFDFEDIAQKIAGKGRYACKDDNNEAPYRFNFARTTTVSGCPVTAALRSVFGDDWLSEIRSLYTLGDGKTEEQIINDVWHALVSFKDEDCLCRWAAEKLQLTDKQAEQFSKINLPQDYAALSLNAINKILPFLRRGYRYDEAVFLANLKAVLPKNIYDDEARRNDIEQDIAELLLNYKRNEVDKNDTKEYRISRYLINNGIDDSRTQKLYHPSMIDTYKKAQPDAEGILQLGSPRTSAVRNPMAMRALFRLRALLNRLLREGKIDRDTKINIEFSRQLNDANKRKAIEQYQRDREAENRKYADEIRKYNIEPTETDILKYRLWEEQQHKCLYTYDKTKDKTQISISDFLGNSKYDIEHTVPRSRGGDDSLMNKTLCDSHFNREIKKAKLPYQLSNYADIMVRIDELGWREKVESLQGQIEKQRRKSKNAATKSEKDNAIQRRHYLQMQLDYWKGKIERFEMTEVPDGFTNRQGVDIGIIGKYARMYLKTVFDRISTVKGETTSEFRKMWGLQSKDEKKERANHVHHCIDAITVACIGHKEYERWTQFVGDREYYDLGQGAMPVMKKPWPTFTEDVKAVVEELLVSHHTADNMPKRSRKKLRIRGKIQYNEHGETKYVQGDTARGSLHQQTFYGAIERNDEIKYVVRKSLDQLQSKEDVDKIVDEVVKQKVKEAIAQFGFKDATDITKHTIWMNEEKRIPIRKVRIFAPTVTSPIHLKPHRDTSAKEYKRDYHVVNDGNYCMAIYEGTDNKGKTKRTFELVNNIEAAQYFKTSADKTARPDLIPQSDANGYPLKCILKTGTMVLFYENTPEELYECSNKDLAKRLYKLTKFSSMTSGNNRYGTIFLRHHQEARPAGDLKAKNGVWKIGEEYRPIISIYHTQLNAYIEGYDFELTVTGEIKFKH